VSETAIYHCHAHTEAGAKRCPVATMAIAYRAVFGTEKRILGVVHLAPLPGAPGWHPPLSAILDRARRDSAALAEGGADGVIVENYGDAPFFPCEVGPETVAAMTRAVEAVRSEIDLPVGVNVLRNDARSALAIAAVAGGRFVRVNVHTGAAVTDQGILEGRAHETLRDRVRLDAEDVAILADVHVKHGRPLAPGPIGEAARDAVERGCADAVLVTGPRTGSGADLADVEAVRGAVPGIPVLVASGVTIETVREILALADGVIVATSLQRETPEGRRVDPDRVRTLVEAAHG